jgi:hypothetical protein
LGTAALLRTKREKLDGQIVNKRLLPTRTTQQHQTSNLTTQDYECLRVVVLLSLLVCHCEHRKKNTRWI